VNGESGTTSFEPRSLPSLRTLPEALLVEIVRQAEAGYPEEICGIVIGQPEAPHTYRVRQVANIANREPQEDTSGEPRDARTAYKMDPLEQLRVLKEADMLGGEVVTIYHSHPNHGAYFSRMDRDRALAANGEPIWPGVEYLVISVVNGRARRATEYRWDQRRGDFAETLVALPGLS
jgi:proteasome lid subunit RPN8/RPN11